jgi:hypothetical protein
MFDGLGRAQPAPDTDLITRCPLRIAALSVEALIILLTAGCFWQARLRTRGAAPEGYPVERRDPESSRLS